MNKEQRKLNTHKPSFDLKTHVRDGKGKIARENHYRLTINAGIKEYERPPGSGYFYDEAGTQIRAPKSGQVQEAKAEFSNDSLLKQIEVLKAQLGAQAKQPAVDEVHQTVQDVEVDDIEVVAAAQADNSEEIALMEKAGATDAAQAVKQKAFQPMFKKQGK